MPKSNPNLRSMRVCNVCNEEKSLKSFSLNGKGKRNYRCKECQKTLSKAHYRKNKKKYRAAMTHLRERRRAFVVEYKKGKPCADCKQEFHPAVMEFDHLQYEGKEASISNLVNSMRSEQAILDEIAKCELVCANCHRMRHVERDDFKERSTKAG